MELALVLERAPLDVVASVPRPSLVFAQLVESHLMFPLLALNATRDAGEVLRVMVRSQGRALPAQAEAIRARTEGATEGDWSPCRT